MGATRSEKALQGPVFMGAHRDCRDYSGLCLGSKGTVLAGMPFISTSRFPSTGLSRVPCAFAILLGSCMGLCNAESSRCPRYSQIDS